MGFAGQGIPARTRPSSYPTVRPAESPWLYRRPFQLSIQSPRGGEKTLRLAGSY